MELSIKLTLDCMVCRAAQAVRAIEWRAPGAAPRTSVATELHTQWRSPFVTSGPSSVAAKEADKAGAAHRSQAAEQSWTDCSTALDGRTTWSSDCKTKRGVYLLGSALNRENVTNTTLQVKWT